MRMSKWLLAAIMSLWCLSGAVASSVTLTVVQNEEAPVIALQMSHTIEDELFGILFEGGHIASNTDIRFDGRNFRERAFGVKEAAFGYSDFLIVVMLQYGAEEVVDEELKTSWAELKTLSWRVVNVRTGEIAAEKKLDPKKIKVVDFDPYKQARLVADKAGADIIDALTRAQEGDSK